jgi:hypothetical protein
MKLKRTAPVVLGTLATVVAAAFPGTTAAQSPLVVKGGSLVTIVHVQKGCHVWTAGKAAGAASAKVLLRRGQRLTVLNKDLDTHMLVRVAGPKLALGKPIMMNGRVTLTFAQPGVYKLRTKQIETPGMPEVETMGPDNMLSMLVVVR